MSEDLSSFEGPILPGLDGTHSPLEAHTGYRGEDWSPEKLAFHQNLEQFAERVGLIVALQGNGKVSQNMLILKSSKYGNNLKTATQSF